MIETDFLFDKERENKELELIAKLKDKWLKSQELIKNEITEVTYSYWDGNGHRYKMSIPKGTTIEAFLKKVCQDLSSSFPHLRSVHPDQLMYIQEDIIIPHHLTFYDLIISKAQGKTGALFSFDVHDDVRMINDIRIESNASHAGKVTERRWYERNRHIYPASNWQLLDLTSFFSESSS